MTGKVLVILLALCAVSAGLSMYYLQVYGYYFEVQPRPGALVAVWQPGQFDRHCNGFGADPVGGSENAAV